MYITAFLKSLERRLLLSSGSWSNRLNPLHIILNYLLFFLILRKTNVARNKAEVFSPQNTEKVRTVLPRQLPLPLNNTNISNTTSCWREKSFCILSRLDICVVDWVVPWHGYVTQTSRGTELAKLNYHRIMTHCPDQSVPGQTWRGNNTHL